jgi:hypothetical protein
MSFSTIPLNPTARMLRQFAAGCLVCFGAMGAHQYFSRGHHQAGLVLAGLALVLGVAGLSKPSTLRWLFVGWMVLAFPIGWVVSQVMLLFMFFCIVTPVAMFFRLRGRDPLARRPALNRTTWWTPKPSPQDVRSYFRQYESR